MQRRILVLIGTVLLVGAVVAGVANRYFAAAASPSVHTFTTGPIEVELRDLQGDPLNDQPIMSATDMAPGDSRAYTASVMNTGLFPFTYHIGLVRTDLAQVDSLDNLNRNDALARALMLTVERLDGVSEDDANAWTLVGVHTVEEWSAGEVTVGSPILFAGGRHKFRFTVDFPHDPTNNEAQAGSVTLRMDVSATGTDPQCENNFTFATACIVTVGSSVTQDVINEDLNLAGETFRSGRYYKIYLQPGQRITTQVLTTDVDPDFYAYAADGFQYFITRSLNPGKMTEEIRFTAATEGWFYLRVSGFDERYLGLTPDGNTFNLKVLGESQLP